jgi:biotin transporter BioY
MYEGNHLMLFWSKLIGGIVLVLVGVFWMLQGLNVIQGYLMSGQTTFFVVGIVVALVGAWLLWSVRANRGKVHVG